jgi:hypothetical protein
MSICNQDIQVKIAVGSRRINDKEVQYEAQMGLI